jgi:sulfur-carrier protein adenylyltransferase/sulfurtransferase
MIWWVNRLDRAESERIAIADLAEKAEWLSSVRWRLVPGTLLVVDFELLHAGEVYPLTLTYPAYFPDTAPIVTPSDGRRLSGHQYGPGGELCLEIRPDNWEPCMTGAMMLESAYHLVSGERGAIPDLPVPSAHRTTLGQNLRSSSCRFLVTAQLIARLAELAPLDPCPITVALRVHGDTLISSIRSVDPDSPSEWLDTLPTPEAWFASGTVVRLPAGTVIPGLITLETTAALLDQLALNSLSGDIGNGTEPTFLLLVDATGYRLLRISGSDSERDVFVYRTLDLPAVTEERRPSEHADLQGKRVGIVGCGSVGSKVAVSLARSGVSKFLLVDDDIFFPGNLVRNELDWRAVGLHKTDALQQRMKEIASDCDISIRRVAFGGQEGAETTASVMAQLATCDLILDATADPRVFNLCAAAARAHMKPMLWVEVLAGGIGGIVARARPDIDPPPQAARRQILRWCEAQQVPWPHATANSAYSADRADAPPLIADDADVTVIAGHAARLAIDLLARPGQSIFPQSAYVIGLSAEWIFLAPFDTCPIDLAPEAGWRAPVDPDISERGTAFLDGIFPSEPDDHADQPAS